MSGIVDIYLTRRRRTDQGTESIFSVPGLNFSSFSFELPWRDNRPNVSCIPPGTYPVSWRESRRWKAFHIRNVPGRSCILIHAGNFAGDVAKGFKTHVQGCVLLGTRWGWLGGQRAILMSRPMVRRFNAIMDGHNARITVTELEAQHA